MISGPRVVVTGIGVVTSVGIGVAAFWRAMLAGESGIGAVESFDTKRYSVHIGGEVKNFDPRRFVERLDTERLAFDPAQMRAEYAPCADMAERYVWPAGWNPEAAFRFNTPRRLAAPQLRDAAATTA